MCIFISFISMEMQVLDANPVHVKALYRRGMAYMSAGEFDEARTDFKKVTVAHGCTIQRKTNKFSILYMDILMLCIMNRVFFSVLELTH